MARRREIARDAVALDEQAAARRAGQLGRRLRLEAVDPPDSPQFVDVPGVAARLAAACAEPDVFRRLELLEVLWRERSDWGAAGLARLNGRAQ